MEKVSGSGVDFVSKLETAKKAANGECCKILKKPSEWREYIISKVKESGLEMPSF